METAKSNIQTDRTVYFDYLRVFATFAVMILHISAQNWFTADVNGFEWQVFNFFDSIVRWCNPIFIMISGALFLGRVTPVKKIYSKYVLRMAISFLFWSAFYMLISDGDIVDRIIMLIHGHQNMWFLLMITGLYICIPIIKPIVENEKRTQYYLLLALVFAFVIPQIVTLTNDFAGELTNKIVSAINNDVANMRMHLVLGCASYFVLGYYLNKIDLSRMQRRAIYILGIAGFALTIGLDLIVAIKTQQSCSNYYGSFTINVLFESIAVFTWFKYKKYRFPQLYPFIIKLSQYSFGAFLVHAFVIKGLNACFGLNTLSFNPALSVVFIGIVVFVVSFVISSILNHIPILKKYIV